MATVVVLPLLLPLLVLLLRFVVATLFPAVLAVFDLSAIPVLIAAKNADQAMMMFFLLLQLEYFYMNV